ncbi:O-antigen translocase [Rhizobium sp. Leaf262]|uniref:O-antigen translocase n=1 Tax=Rhizobium sp. Leaf262 TaxID=1736312 RepID=UPI000713E649|nr:O-antigen translocase [Rhizobium sp. Leaf262]KQO76285.1 hypothetical protein ASF29_09915 [Rhizobium sp. Leaf262]
MNELQPEKTGYVEILRSTALIGGSSAITMVFAILRTKAMAVLLGPEGIGLIGIFNSIADMTQAVAGLGVQASGVRQIAEAVGTGDRDKIARTAFILKRTSTLLGLIGAVLLAALSFPIGYFTFGDQQQSLSIGLLSAAIFFRLASAGQTALLQGLRKISLLAQVNIVTAFFTTATTIPMVFYFNTGGIVPALVASSAAMLLSSWWFSRRLAGDAPTMSLSHFGQDLKPLIRLGFVFMMSGLLTLVSAYVVRLIVLQAGGVLSAGLYQAAWALGSLYSGFILQAMGTDFYPRLTAISADHNACNKLVNEQARVSMLLAGPGVLATLTFAPLVMWLFYSPEFHAASDLLRWICIGMLLRIVSWPMGYIVLAKGAQAIFFWTEVAATLVHIGLAYLLVEYFGIVGAAVAFCGLYVWHTLAIFLIVRRLTGFRWSSENCKTGALFFGLSGLIFAATLWLPLWQATVLGSVTVLGGSLHSVSRLIRLLPEEMLPTKIRRWVLKTV